jgi:hypothetical protein
MSQGGFIMAGKKQTSSAVPDAQQPSTTEQGDSRKRWVKLTPRDHVLKQIEIQRELVESLRTQLQKEEQTLQGMEKAKEFFPA